MHSWINRRYCFAGLFAALMLLGLGAGRTVFAQAHQCSPGTIPGEPGTIPGFSGCLFLPLIDTPPSQAVYDAVPVEGTPLDRAAATHPDINLAVRGYTSVTATLELMDIGGPTDADAPQLAGMFTPPRLPTFTAAHQVYDWDWSCDGGLGCLGAPIAQPEVTLIDVAVAPDEPISIPLRAPQIYEGGYKALVLYAEARRITLTYTREDNPAIGYMVHLEDLRVDPNLVLLYQQLDAAGRTALPALREGERLGNATSQPLKVAIRDTGSFLDPRSRKDWWMDYRQLLTRLATAEE